jgi:hypothetical protein
MKSGWFETDGKTTREIPAGWRKEWTDENIYGWIWFGPPHSVWVNLCVLPYEPNAEQRAEIEHRFADAKEPPSPTNIESRKRWADKEEERLRALLEEPPK